MDYQTATNPQTGEKLIEIAGAWKPLEASATNRETGAKAFKVGGQWIAPPRSPQSYAGRVASTGAAFDQAVRAGGAGPLTQLARTGVAAGENALSIGSGTIGDVLGAGASVLTQNPERGEAIRRLLTYEPHTPAGQAGSRYVGAIMQPVGEVLGAPQAYLERHGHPIAAQELTAAEDLAGSEETVAGRGAQALTRAPLASESVREAERAGFVLPISQSKPGLLPKVAESIAGKIHTQQQLSGANIKQGNALVRQGLGLAPDAPLTPETMAEIRRQAGEDYAAVAQVPGQVKPSQAFREQLDEIAASRKGGIRETREDDPIVQATAQIERVGSFTTSQGLAEIRSLRDDAERAFAQGDKRLGSDYRRLSLAVEDMIGEHLDRTLGNPTDLSSRVKAAIAGTGGAGALLERFRAARKRIAQSYDVENALDGAGNVDLQKLGNRFAKGGMSGEIATAGQFGQQFRKYAQVPAKTGSKLPFSLVGAAATGGLGALAGAGHGHALAGAVAAEGARMLVQKLTTTKAGQRAIRAADRSARRALETSARAGAAAAPIANTLRALDARPTNPGGAPQ